MRQCRSLTFQLSPRTLHEMGLDAGLEELTRHVQKVHGLECSISRVGHTRCTLDRDPAIIVFLYRSHTQDQPCK